MPAAVMAATASEPCSSFMIAATLKGSTRTTRRDQDSSRAAARHSSPPLWFLRQFESLAAALMVSNSPATRAMARPGQPSSVSLPRGQCQVSSSMAPTLTSSRISGRPRPMRNSRLEPLPSGSLAISPSDWVIVQADQHRGDEDEHARGFPGA